MKRELRNQLNKVKKLLDKKGDVYKSFVEMHKLLEMVLVNLEEKLSDKKIKQKKTEEE